MHEPAPRQVPPGSTPLRELAHAIAGALALPRDVATLSELAYLRVSPNHARVVLFAMRRIISDRELDDRGLMTIVQALRDQTAQLPGAARDHVEEPS